MNPELKRNFLIEITGQRLLAMPLILGLIFAAAWALEDSKGLITTTEVLFWVLVFLWGTRKAAGAFDSEMANNTWDSQRLSALTAGQIFVGKLFGSTSFVLYGALLSLLVNVAARFDLYVTSLDDADIIRGRTVVLDPGEIIWSAGHDLLVGLLGLVVAMFVAVVLMARTRSSKGISVTLCQLFAIGVAGVFADRIGNVGLAGFSRGLTHDNFLNAEWYGLSIPIIGFITASLLIYLAWTVLGTVRQLRSVLQFRGYRWAWPLFVLFVGAYLAGFDTLYQHTQTFGNQAFLFLTVFWMVAVTFTYLAVFSETKSLQGYRSYITAARRLRFSEIMQHQPFWLTSLIILVITLILNLALGEAQVGIRHEMDSDLGNFLGLGSAAPDLQTWLVLASLFLVRDCLLVMALNFTPNRRRADLAALIYLAVLYVIVPLLLHGINLDQTLLMKFFVPQVGGGLIASVWPIALEVAVVAILMMLRWRTVRQPVAADIA
ncbi:MAG: hypothetical protein GKS02_13235 [Alphaproteobacteria bacterium]|nr:hypothetical protein [Alphaproteobacteria bacterium]